MNRIIVSVLIAAAAATAAVFAVSSIRTVSNTSLAAEDPQIVSAADPKPQKTMKPFSSEAAFVQFFKEQRKAKRSVAANAATTDSAAAPTSSAAKESKAEESITNNQTAGVDEGGIVKNHGDHLVILRRGRLFTVRIGDNSLKPVSLINAFAPGVSPSGDWYDEMLISGDNIVVIGFSYSRGGTELNMFKITPEGRLSYNATYHLRSNDYYSSRNYASRLIGNKLVFYTPTYLGFNGSQVSGIPAVRRWTGKNVPGDFRPVLSGVNIYRPSRDIGDYTTLHTVTSCDIGTGSLECKGTGVLGSWGRVFYVSANSVYVWTGTSYQDAEAGSMLFRMPLDASAPSAIGAAGGPVDQFSFLESEGNLNVFVRKDFYGDSMWNAEVSEGNAALLRLSLSEFGDGSENTRRGAYLKLDAPQDYSLQNRFVGDHLLYGSGDTWFNEKKNLRPDKDLNVVNWRTGNTSKLAVPHHISRIEQLGDDAIVIGPAKNDLYFTPVSLAGAPELRTPFIRRDAAQSETRSHGFFYRSTGRDSGILGLPIARSQRPGYHQLRENSSSMIFLRNTGLHLSVAGELNAESVDQNDGCRASCVDWYGNSRPIFIGNRILALMGYEIVEGSLRDGRLTEKRRISFSPSAMASREYGSKLNDLSGVFDDQ